MELLCLAITHNLFHTLEHVYAMLEVYWCMSQQNESLSTILVRVFPLLLYGIILDKNLLAL